MEVNGKNCKVLQDTGATYDVVHSSFVNENDFTAGDYVCLRQALEGGTVSLRVAKVILKGYFGEVETEAAVLDVLPRCPYLSSNRTAKELLKSGVKLDINPVMIVTRSMTKKSCEEIVDQAVASKASAADDSYHPVEKN